MCGLAAGHQNTEAHYALAMQFTRNLSPHQLGLFDVLTALPLTDEVPRKLMLIGVEPASLSPYRPDGTGATSA